MTNNNKYGKNMKLFTSYWGEKDTFKLMPIDNNCPFSEVIYDPTSTLLVVISNIGKQQFQNVPRLDNDGNSLKAKKPKMNGKPYQELRVMMETLTEYYVTTVEEQEDFIKDFAVNAESYDYNKFLRNIDTEPAIEGMADLKKGITDEHGTAISSI